MATGGGSSFNISGSTAAASAASAAAAAAAAAPMNPFGAAAEAAAVAATHPPSSSTAMTVGINGSSPLPPPPPPSFGDVILRQLLSPSHWGPAVAARAVLGSDQSSCFVEFRTSGAATAAGAGQGGSRGGGIMSDDIIHWHGDEYGVHGHAMQRQQQQQQQQGGDDQMQVVLSPPPLSSSRPTTTTTATIATTAGSSGQTHAMPAAAAFAGSGLGSAGDVTLLVHVAAGLQIFHTSPLSQLWLIPQRSANQQQQQQQQQPQLADDTVATFSLEFASESACSTFLTAVREWQNPAADMDTVSAPPAQQRQQQGQELQRGAAAPAAAAGEGGGRSGGSGAARGSGTSSVFDEKTEAASAKMYFHYYGQLLHQQNMLQDYVRTGTYFAAVVENKADFEGKVVVDVGAGSGILSLFAARAGARHVYAIEASSMAEYAKKLLSGNPSLGDRITVIHGKVEEVSLPEKADVLISEPMGTLLVNERMLESYIIARDKFLKPHGKMFPALGRIRLAPFTDEYLYVEMANKALFWQQHSYYGIDLTPLHADAFSAYFSQPVVDAFDPRVLIAPTMSHTIDFSTAKEEDLFEVDIPLSFKASMAARVHGLACWFDVLFNGSSVQRWLTTAPGSPTTHWYQLRCVLSQPLYVFAGQQITGRLHLVSHSSQSYTIYLTMSSHAWSPNGELGNILQTSTGKLDLKEPYYRLSQTSTSWAQEQPQVQQTPPEQQGGSEQNFAIDQLRMQGRDEDHRAMEEGMVQDGHASPSTSTRQGIGEWIG